MLLNTVLMQLCKATITDSCHTLVKYILNIGFCSGLLKNGMATSQKDCFDVWLKTERKTSQGINMLWKTKVIHTWIQLKSLKILVNSLLLARS